MCLTVARAGLAQDGASCAGWNGVDAGAWEAVGRLDIAARAFGTGALIAPRMVLTAAHCLYEEKKQTNALTTQKSNFLAGWRNGRGRGAYGT